MKASIILPTYNEKENIVKLIEKIKTAFSTAKIQVEVIVVDDNSPDGTAEQVRKHFKRPTKSFEVKLFERKAERGLPTAIRYGMDRAEGDLIGAMDTDLSHPVKCLTKMAKKAQGKEMILFNATRWKRGGGMNAPFKSFWLSKIINIFLRITLKRKITDFTGGFFVIDAKTYKRFSNSEKEFIFNSSKYGEYYIKFLEIATIRNAEIFETAFVYEPRRSGVSKTNVLKYGKLYIDVVKDIKKWRKQHS